MPFKSQSDPSARDFGFPTLIFLDELVRFFKQLRSTSVTLVCVVWLKCRSLGVRDLEVSLGDQQSQKQPQYRRTVVTFTDASSYLHCDRAPNQFRANQSEPDLLKADRARRIDVVIQFVSNVFNDLLRLHAIAGLIEPRRKHGNCALARNHGDNPTAYAALCR